MTLEAATDGPIIDAHVHLWDQRRTPRQGSALVKALGWSPRLLAWAAERLFPRAAFEFFGKADYVLGDYLPPDYAADVGARRVDGIVHVEAGWVGKGPLGPVAETRWLEGLGMPQLRGIVGHADLSAGPEVDAVLAAHVDASPRFRGVRDMLAHHPDARVHDGAADASRMTDPMWRRGYALLSKHGLSFEATVYDHQLPDLAELAGAFPDVPVVLAHAGTPIAYGGPFGGQGGTPDERDRIRTRWKDGMRRLADASNVCIKISGLAMPCVGWAYHRGAPPTASRVADDLAPLVDFVIDTFGAERCMLASNFPVEKVSVAWATLYEAFAHIVDGRSPAERRSLFHDTAAASYRL